MEAPQQRKQALLIADSNRKYLIPELNKGPEEWSHTDEIFTIEQLNKTSKDDEFKKENFDAIYIMQGTNDIRHGGNGIKEAKKLARTIQELQQVMTNTKIVAVEIPPSKIQN